METYRTRQPASQPETQREVRATPYPMHQAMARHFSYGLHSERDSSLYLEPNSLTQKEDIQHVLQTKLSNLNLSAAKILQARNMALEYFPGLIYSPNSPHLAALDQRRSATNQYLSKITELLRAQFLWQDTVEARLQKAYSENDHQEIDKAGRQLDIHDTDAYRAYLAARQGVLDAVNMPGLIDGPLKGATDRILRIQQEPRPEGAPVTHNLDHLMNLGFGAATTVSATADGTNANPRRPTMVGTNLSCALLPASVNQLTQAMAGFAPFRSGQSSQAPIPGSTTHWLDAAGIYISPTFVAA